MVHLCRAQTIPFPLETEMPHPSSRFENIQDHGSHQHPDFGIDMSKQADALLAAAGKACPSTKIEVPLGDEFGTVKLEQTPYGKWLVEQNSDALNAKPTDAPIELSAKQQEIAARALEIVQTILEKKYAGNPNLDSEIDQLQRLFGGSKDSLNFRMPKEFFKPISEYLKQQFNERYQGIVGIGTSDVTGQTYLGFNRGTLEKPNYLPQYWLGGSADCSQYNGPIN